MALKSSQNRKEIIRKETWNMKKESTMEKAKVWLMQ